MESTPRQVAEDLYAVPLGDFVRRRNELAKQARSANREAADAIAALPKPSTAAWAVNILARRYADELGELLDLGRQLRAAQEDLAGDVLRQLTAQSGAAVRRLTKQARAAAAELGTPLSDSVVRQFEQTLRAAMADADAAEAVRAGVPAKPLAPSGFGDVDTEAAIAVASADDEVDRRSSRGRQAAKPASERKHEQARRSAESALNELERAEHDVAGREEEVEAVATEHAVVRDVAEQLRDELANAEQREAELGSRLRDARRQRDAAAGRMRSARRAAERAQARLDKLDGSPRR